MAPRGCFRYVDFITSTLPQVFTALDVTTTTLIVRDLGVCGLKWPAGTCHTTSLVPPLTGVVRTSRCAEQIAPIFWGLSMLRTYRFLAFTSILGDIAVTAGIISVVVYGATQHSFKVGLVGRGGELREPGGHPPTWTDTPSLRVCPMLRLSLPQFDVPQFEPTSFPKFIGSTSFLFAIHIVVCTLAAARRPPHVAGRPI